MTTSALAIQPAEVDEMEPFIGLAPLMRQAFSGIDLKPLGAKFIEHATHHPDDPHALMNLATVLFLTGNRELALATQMEALQIQQLYHLPASGQEKLRLLALMAPGDLMANTPLEFLLENSDVSLDLLYVGEGIPPVSELPDHDAMFVAIGESDENLPLLKELENVLRTWARPVLNAPGKITLLSRDSACRLLSSAPGIEMPVAVRIDKQTLQKIGGKELPVENFISDGSYPVIVRPVGSHAGHGLEKLDSADAIRAYLQTSPSEEFYIARFVDYRSKDGQFRKYRIMLIEGRPFICHMAISTNWMIHYLNAGMADSAEKRAEEAALMSAFDNDFALRHKDAFRAITERIGLDYVGIDCGETPDGRLLIFEADSDMIVHAMDPAEMFPYKQPVMRKLFGAFREMLSNASASRSI